MAQPKISEAVSLLQAGYTSAVQQGLIYKNHPLAVQWASLILRFANKGDATRRELNQLTATMNAGVQQDISTQEDIFSLPFREFIDRLGAMPLEESDLDTPYREIVMRQIELRKQELAIQSDIKIGEIGKVGDVVQIPEMKPGEQLAQAATQAAGAIDDLSAALKQTGLPEIPEIPEQDLGKSEPDSNPAQQDQNQAQLFQTEDAAVAENKPLPLLDETLNALSNSQVKTIISKYGDRMDIFMAQLGIENKPDYTAEQKAAAIRAEAKKRLQ